MEEKYQCHICMEVAQKPIVTPCGHLFCWQCIYHWLRSNQEYLTCPLCKSGLELSSVRPILVPDQPLEKEENGIPPRPCHRAKVRQRRNWRQLPRCIAGMGMNLQRGVMLAGYGIFPSVYQCLFQHFQPPRPTQMEQEDVEHKLYSRLRIGATVMICLLIVAVLIL